MPPPLVDRLLRRTLEVHHDEIPVAPQHLREVIVAVRPRLQETSTRFRDVRAGELEQARLVGEHRGSDRLRILGEHCEVLAQCGKGCRGSVA